MKWSGLIALMAIEGILLCAGITLASRNSSGTYSLPTPGVPFQSNQTISSTQVNNTLNDIATTLTNSLDRNGNGGMLVALRGIDGTVAAPAFSWTSETGSGYYRVGTGDLGLAISGTRVGQVTANGYRTGNGAVGTPSWSFLNDTSSGLYRAGSNDIRLAINGVDSQLWNAAGSGNTVLGTWYEPALADGGFVQTYLGKAAGTGTAGVSTYTKNATAANSTYCLGVYGGSASALCVDGNSKVYLGAGSTAISATYRGTVSWTPGSLVGVCATNTITLTGAAAGADCTVTPPSALGQDTILSCTVTNNTCNLNVCVVATFTQTPPAGTYACRVFNP